MQKTIASALPCRTMRRAALVKHDPNVSRGGNRLDRSLTWSSASRKPLCAQRGPSEQYRFRIGGLHFTVSGLQYPDSVLAPLSMAGAASRREMGMPIPVAGKCVAQTGDRRAVELRTANSNRFHEMHPQALPACSRAGSESGGKEVLAGNGPNLPTSTA
jgi:hypothetical protein